MTASTPTIAQEASPVPGAINDTIATVGGKMPRHREFLMLASSELPNRLGNWFLSEKLDGVRALWLPTTRGLRTDDINFANRPTLPISTGLWSRYANVINAPAWWLGHLPDIPLDGELYLGRGRFQQLVSKVRAHNGNWDGVEFRVFDSPTHAELFTPGIVNNINYKKVFMVEGSLKGKELEGTRFENRHPVLKRTVPWNKVCLLHEQEQLHWNSKDAELEMHDKMKEITSQGGEGLILRAPESTWQPYRSKLMIKVKQILDSEAKVIGHNPGQGRLRGMLGSLRVRWGAVEFDLSGFTDAERRNPPPIGSMVTFTYRELTDDGMPKEARFLRKRETL